MLIEQNAPEHRYSSDREDEYVSDLETRSINTVFYPISKLADIVIDKSTGRTNAGYRYTIKGLSVLSDRILPQLKRVILSIGGIGDKTAREKHSNRTCSMEAAINIYNEAVKARFSSLRNCKLVVDAKTSSIVGLTGPLYSVSLDMNVIKRFRNIVRDQGLQFHSGLMFCCRSWTRYILPKPVVDGLYLGYHLDSDLNPKRWRGQTIKLCPFLYAENDGTSIGKSVLAIRHDIETCLDDINPPRLITEPYAVNAKEAERELLLSSLKLPKSDDLLRGNVMRSALERCYAEGDGVTTTKMKLYRAVVAHANHVPLEYRDLIETKIHSYFVGNTDL